MNQLVNTFEIAKPQKIEIYLPLLSHFWHGITNKRGSLLFMPYIEKMIHYLEISLHESQSYSLYAMGNSMMMFNVFTKLYFWGPMLYLGLISITGIAVGSAINTAFDKRSSGAAMNAVEKGASKAAAALE